MSSKYIIIKTEIAHSPEFKVILFDNWFWHGNFLKDNWTVHSCGFFNVVRDPLNDYGFRVTCGGSATDLKPGSLPGDDKIIKEMLLGFKIMYY